MHVNEKVRDSLEMPPLAKKKKKKKGSSLGRACVAERSAITSCLCAPGWFVFVAAGQLWMENQHSSTFVGNHLPCWSVLEGNCEFLPAALSVSNPSAWCWIDFSGGINKPVSALLLQRPSQSHSKINVQGSQGDSCDMKEHINLHRSNVT